LVFDQVDSGKSERYTIEMKTALFRSILTCCALFVVAPTHANGEEMYTRDISIDLPLSLTVAQAWNAWTQNDKLEEWLTAKANVDVRVGGAYELFWQPETPNQNSTIGCKVTAMLPQKLLAFEWKGAVQFSNIMNVTPLPTWVSISFESTGSNSSIIHFRHSGWQAGADWDAARQWQTRSWMGALEELKKLH
jgi:uncharacterized protein YndB with AHSA1/START domain